MAVSFQAGLRDVIAADSALCTVDGAAGKLRYRGYDIADLAEHASFEEVCWLLWEGDLPTRTQLEPFARSVAREREVPPPVLEAMSEFPRGAHPLEALRAAAALLAMYDPDVHDNSAGANRRKRARLTGQIATLVAAWKRTRESRPVVRPETARSHAANFLYMLSGSEPDPISTEAMDAVLVLHAEHEFNASTFAARVTAATFADMHTAMVAAISALKGPRHGGANEDVLAMLEEIGGPDRAESFIRAKLAAREKMTREERADPRNRIPGFGHPVYKVDDPRAARLRSLGQRLAAVRGETKLFETAEVVYRIMHENTDLPVNVDFYSAVIYKALDIPIDLCTSVFATARIAGWTAHIIEQYGQRLIRPRANYTGPGPRDFVPIDRRG